MKFRDKLFGTRKKAGLTQRATVIWSIVVVVVIVVFLYSPLAARIGGDGVVDGTKYRDPNDPDPGFDPAVVATVYDHIYRPEIADGSVMEGTKGSSSEFFTNYAEAKAYLDVHYSDIPGFGTEYGEKFFEEHALGLFYIELTSGSQTVEVTGTSIDTVWHKAKVEFAVFLPEIGTADMDGAAIAVSVPKEMTGIDYSVQTIAADKAPFDGFYFSKLPADYGKEQAAKDGVYVNIRDEEVFNPDALERFLADVAAEIPADLRTLTYTDEGDPLLTEYHYDGNELRVLTDRLMDQIPEDGAAFGYAYYGYWEISKHLPVK